MAGSNFNPNLNNMSDEPWALVQAVRVFSRSKFMAATLPGDPPLTPDNDVDVFGTYAFNLFADGQGVWLRGLSIQQRHIHQLVERRAALMQRLLSHGWIQS